MSERAFFVFSGMKILISIALCLFLIPSLQANAIDSLHTKEEVQQFLMTEIDSIWRYYFAWEKNVSDTSEFGQNRFFKLDLDHNGRTDLLVNARYLFAITDRGDGTYGVHIPGKWTHFSKTRLLGIYSYEDAGEKDPIIGLLSGNANVYDTQHKEREDHLVFRYGNFMEFNNEPDDSEIESIAWTTDMCYDTCRVCSYTLYADRRAVCEAYFANGNTKRLKTFVDTATFHRIFGTVHYVGAAPLSQSYLANWTHARFIKMEIRYKNGLKKVVSDEGLIGSYGLVNLYEQLFELRKTQCWKKKKK